MTYTNDNSAHASAPNFGGNQHGAATTYTSVHFATVTDASQYPSHADTATGADGVYPVAASAPSGYPSNPVYPQGQYPETGSAVPYHPAHGYEVSHVGYSAASNNTVYGHSGGYHQPAPDTMSHPPPTPPAGYPGAPSVPGGYQSQYGYGGGGPMPNTYDKPDGYPGSEPVKPPPPAVMHGQYPPPASDGMQHNAPSKPNHTESALCGLASCLALCVCCDILF